MKKRKKKMSPEDRARSDEIGRRLEQRIAELKALRGAGSGQERRASS
jgi:hypothetical protein